MILRQVFLMKKDLLIFLDFQRPVLKCEALRSVFDAHLARQDLRKARLVAAEALRHFREQNNKKAQACRCRWGLGLHCCFEEKKGRWCLLGR